MFIGFMRFFTSVSTPEIDELKRAKKRSDTRRKTAAREEKNVVTREKRRSDTRKKA